MANDEKKPTVKFTGKGGAQRTLTRGWSCAWCEGPIEVQAQLRKDPSGIGYHTSCYEKMERWCRLVGIELHFEELGKPVEKHPNPTPRKPA